MQFMIVKIVLIFRTDTSGKTGLDYVIQYIAKALQPKESESAGFLGDLVVKLIKKVI
jgi:hypothetical protein